MRRLVSIAVLTPFTLVAQSFVDASHLAAAREAFAERAAAGALKCQFSPVQPALDYSLRLETGFSVDMPMNQFRRNGHGWDVLLRVTPAGRAPVFLTVSELLSHAPSWKEGEFRGTFFVGEGDYQVDALLKDDTQRVCRSSWRIQAKREGVERRLAPLLEPGSVAEADSKPSPAMAAGDPVVGRVSVLVHAASFVPGRAKIDEDDVRAFSGSLESLSKYLPVRTLRVVVFDLDRPAPIYENDDFRVADVDAAAKALEGAQLAVVDYKTLQNTRGPVQAAAALMRREAVRADAPEAIVVLGPYSPISERASSALSNPRAAEGSKLYYLQFKSYRDHAMPVPDAPIFGPDVVVPMRMPRGMPQMSRPDPLELVTRAMKGDRIEVFRPHEFAGAIQRIAARLSGR